MGPEKPADLLLFYYSTVMEFPLANCFNMDRHYLYRENTPISEMELN
jgi:hypothetical protein